MEVYERLKKYLTARLEQRKDVSITDFRRAPKGGSRECYTFTMEWGEGDASQRGGFVLRRDPDASLLESDRETEFRVLKALEGSNVPAPKVYWLEKGETILERPFMIMEQVVGESTPFFQLICPDNPALRKERAKETVALLAELHKLDWESRGLGFLGVPASATSYAEMQVDHWESEFKRVKLDPQPVLTEAFLWLRLHIPTSRNTSLLHGDFKTDNLMFEGSRIKGILDWEMAAIGDPVADLAWFCLDRWSVDGLRCGLMDQEDFISMWKRLSGFEVDKESFLFWMVFSNVKMAVIHLTGGHSFSTGATTNLRMAYTTFENMRVLKDICEFLNF
jgi:aminoglycoside phosphotransferase (APT) family kinase protein